MIRAELATWISAPAMRRRGHGYTDVVGCHPSKCFDTILHDDLVQSVARHSVDRDMLRLIKQGISLAGTLRAK